MDKEELSIALLQPVQLQMVSKLVGLLESNDINIGDIFYLCLHGKKQSAFRAAWMLEHLMVNQPQEFAPFIATLFHTLPLVENQSVLRHYVKIISLLTDKKNQSAYMAPIAIIDFNPIIELLFNWLLDDCTLVATKVHCMQSLANLSSRFQWIGTELLPTISYLESKESIAFFARAKVIKKTLLKQIQNT